METKNLLKSLKRRLGLITTALAMLLVSQGIWAASYTVYVYTTSPALYMYTYGSMSLGDWPGKQISNTSYFTKLGNNWYKCKTAATGTYTVMFNNNSGCQVEDLKNISSDAWITAKTCNSDERYGSPTDYYLPGTFNSWSTTSTKCSSFDEGKQAFKYSTTLDAGDHEFRIYKGAWYGTGANSTRGNVSVTKESDGNLKFTLSAKSNVTIYYDCGNDVAFVDATAACTDPTATQYPMTNATKTYGSVSAPTITPASGAGTVKTIYYTGVSPTSYSKSSTLPTNAGTYKVTVDVNAGSTYCAKNSIDLTGNFVINKANQSALTFNGSTQCVGTNVTLSASGGSSDQTITYKKKSGEGTVSGTTLTTSTAGNVVVTATRPGGTNYNDVTADATFTFTAKPTAYAVSGTATICTGNNTNVTLANSQTGYTYKLYKGGSATTTTKTGTTGSALNFSVSEAGTYTVKGYVTGNESCATDMTGSAVITVNQNMALTSISLSSASECIGGTSNITPNGLNLGGGSISYTSSNSSVASVSGTTITAKSAGTVTITGTVSGGCGSSVSKTANFTVKASNAISSISFTKSPLKVDETCTASAVYTTEGGTGSWSADGTYATITAGGVVTGKKIGTATITYTITGGCGTSPLSKSATLEIITNCESPTAGSIGGTTSICAGNSTTLTLSGQTAGTNLQWYKSTDGSSYSAVSGAKGTSLSTGTLNANAYYKVRVSRTDDASCYSETTPVTVTVTQIPSIATHTDGSRCGAGTVTLGATASAGTINWYAASTSGSSLGTGTSYTTPSISTTTKYYVDATQNGCTTASRTAVTATVNTVPSIGSISAPANACGAGDITFTANSVTGSATVTWYENSTQLGTGNSYTFTAVPAGTSHSVTAKATLNGCTSSEKNASASRLAVPTLTINAPTAYAWEDATFTYTSNGSVTGSVTQKTGTGGIISGDTFKGHVGDVFTGSYTATNTTTGCTTSDSADVTVTRATESCD